MPGRGPIAAEEIRRKLHAVASEPRYAEAAHAFAAKYESFDPAAQVKRMVQRVEELVESKRQGRGQGKKP